MAALLRVDLMNPCDCGHPIEDHRQVLNPAGPTLECVRCSCPDFIEA